MVLLAILSLATFVSAMLALFTNIDKNFSFNTQFFVQRAEELKKRAEMINDDTPEVEKEIEEIETSVSGLRLVLYLAFIWMVIRGLFFILTLVLRKLLVEPILIVWALVVGVEPSILGLIVLCVWFSSWHINYKRVKAEGQKRNYLLTIYNLIPSFYLLYVFLVLTHIV